MVVRHRLIWFLTQREPVKHLVIQEDLVLAISSGRLKDSSTGSSYAPLKLLAMSPKHKLEQISDGLSVFANLLLGVWIENSQAGVDMPLLRVDAESEVDFHVLYSSNIAGMLPRKLCVRVPCFAHGEERSMSDSLRVRSNLVVLSSCEVYDSGVETGQDFLDLCEALITGAMLNQNLAQVSHLSDPTPFKPTYQRLASWINVRAV